MSIQTTASFVMALPSFRFQSEAGSNHDTSLLRIDTHIGNDVLSRLHALNHATQVLDIFLSRLLSLRGWSHRDEEIVSSGYMEAEGEIGKDAFLINVGFSSSLGIARHNRILGRCVESIVGRSRLG